LLILLPLLLESGITGMNHHFQTEVFFTKGSEARIKLYVVVKRREVLATSV
jgi:hypothetical protein